MQRFHLSFDYQGKHTDRSSGEQVVTATCLRDAVYQIANERYLTSIHIRKRYHLGKPAKDAEIIDRDFEF